MRKCPGFLSLAVFAFLVAVSNAQSTGPDVIVGEIDPPDNYGPVGALSAFAFGTTSCNIGTTILNWNSGTNQHPVISQSLFRLKNNRFEQIGVSWLKHGFFALQNQLCATCVPHPNGGALGVGCADPYSAGLNGQQGSLGPRSDVNAATGIFPYNFSLNPPIVNALTTRLQAANSDLDPAQNAGARYFVEAHYVAADDALANNKNNNASYREVTVFPFGAGFGFNFAGLTVRTQPAIRAWNAVDPSVQIQDLDVPGDGRFIVAVKNIDLGNGTRRYEYAVHNLNSDRSGQAFTVTVPAGATIANAAFHDINYHSGEIWSGTDWTPTIAANGITWQSATFATSPTANALRWGTTYSFTFESNVQPTQITLGLFKPGTPSAMTIPHPTPPVPTWQVNQAAASLDLDGLTNNAFQGPVIANRFTGNTITAHFSSTSAGQPWDLATTSVPGVANVAVLGGTQIVNLNFGHPSLAFTNNGFASNWPGGTVNRVFTAPASPFALTAQFAVITPALAAGVALSACNELYVTACVNATQALILGDDDSNQVNLGVLPHCGVTSIPFYGTSHTRLFVNSNGSVSFVSGSTDFVAALGAFVGQMPRLAGMWTDLDPSSGGTIQVSSTTAGLLTVAFNAVPEYGTSFNSSFQFEFNTPAGSCAILNYAPNGSHGTDTLVGISPGGNAISLQRTWPSYLNLGSQNGSASAALYQLVLGAAPTGYSRINFPTSNGATFSVQ